MSRESIITYGKDITRKAMMSCFRPAGTIVATFTITETIATRTARLTFETTGQAERAVRDKELWLLEAI